MHPIKRFWYYHFRLSRIDQAFVNAHSHQGREKQAQLIQELIEEKFKKSAPEKIAFSCQKCKTRYEADPQQSGKVGRCKNCGAELSVPKAYDFRSKFLLSSEVHSFLVILLLLLDVFSSYIFNIEFRHEIELARVAVYLFLILWGTLNLLVTVYLADDRDVYYFKIRRFNELVEKPNTSEYVKIFFLLWLGQFAFDSLKIAGLVLFTTLAFFYTLFSLAVILQDFKKTKTWTTSIIGHLVLLCFLLIWSKNTYTRINGDEVIGSFFEKSEYRTQYYVNLYPETNSSKKYKLKADIWVFNETDEDYDGRSYTYKVILVERVYFKNGGYLYFDDCQVEVNRKEYCIDQNSRGWYIELTEAKVE